MLVFTVCLYKALNPPLPTKQFFTSEYIFLVQQSNKWPKPFPETWLRWFSPRSDIRFNLSPTVAWILFGFFWLCGILLYPVGTKAGDPSSSCISARSCHTQPYSGKVYSITQQMFIFLPELLYMIPTQKALGSLIV